MFTENRVLSFVVLLFGLLLVACGASADEAPMVEESELAEAPMDEGAVAEPVEEPAPLPQTTPMPTATAPVARSGGDTLPEVASRPERLIVKNADLQLRVEDTDVAIDRVTQVVGDTGGYIISSRVWYEEWLEEEYKYASITVGVPVDRFETAMRRFRDIAVQVVDERASGQDVTDEYVDLQSRLRNLEATRDRIRGFLDQAESVEESLRINEELKAVEAEIEQVQGRMNYLYDRAAYSTVTLQLQPDLPAAPEPPTPTPTPEPQPWTPGQTMQAATTTLTTILQIVTEMAIWFAVVILPVFGLPLLVLYGVWRLARRWMKDR
jgi:hypothetical protein